MPVVLENGPEKTPGLILRLTATGMQVETDKILFAVGTYLTANIQFEPNVVLIEKVRSVKHYDKFFRKPPTKKSTPGEPAAQPKRLCELHFVGLSDSSRLMVGKYILRQQEKARELAKQKMKNSI